MYKKFDEFSIIWENGQGAFSCPPTWLLQYQCMEIFKTLNSRNFCIYWCINLKLAEIFQNGVIYVVLKFFPKTRKFRFLMTSLQTKNKTIAAIKFHSIELDFKDGVSQMQQLHILLRGIIPIISFNEYNQHLHPKRLTLAI